MKRKLFIFVVAMPFIVALICLLASNRSGPVTGPSLPNPNGYDELVQAGEMVQGPVEDYEKMNEADLAALVSSNALPLTLEHSAITNECQVPVQYSIPYMTNHLGEITALKDLAQAMAAQGRLAELRNRPMEAAGDYLDLMRFGAKSSCGGVWIDAVLGMAFEETASRRLENLIEKLDATSSHGAATVLESLDEHHENWNDIAGREKTKDRKLSFLGYVLASVVMHKQISAADKKERLRFAESQREICSLAIRFAARAYELEKKRPPKGIADLVPAYLRAVPKDPTTGKDMVYPP